MAAFFLYACLSSLWAPDWTNSVWRLWEFACIGLAMWLGASLKFLRGIVIGLALGLTVSSLLSVVQKLGFQPVLWLNTDGQAGLFYNQVFQGMTIALVILLLIRERLWLFIPLLLPGLYLSNSRGAWFALGVGLMLEVFRSWQLLLLACGAVFTYLTFGLSSAEHERVQIIVGAVTNLSLFGNGAGSFLDLWIGPKRPEFAHNDILQLIFEFGIFAAIPVGLLCWTGRMAVAPLGAFIFLGFFTFPLFTPLPAIIFGLLAGHLSAHPAHARDPLSRLRHDRLSRFPGYRPGPVVPLQPQN